jgi:hypothetical protein
MNKACDLHHKKTRIVAIAALAVAVLGLTTAFAALSTTLTINGSTEIDASNWDIHFSSTSSSVAGTAEISGLTTGGSGVETISFNALFKKPGDTATINYTILNGGGINAKLSTVNISLADANGGTSVSSNEVACTTKYAAGSTQATVTAGNTPATNDLLDSGKAVNGQIICTFDADSSLSPAQLAALDNNQGTYIATFKYDQN